MDFKKISYRVTLFQTPQDPLSQDFIVQFFIPFAQLRYMPSVNKGTAVKVLPDGQFQVSEAWSADFKKDDNSTKVTLTADRIDIINETNMSWDAFIKNAYEVMEVVSKFFNTYNRIAVGTTFDSQKNESLEKDLYDLLFKNEFNPNMVEWSSRVVERKTITHDNSSIDINNVTTVTALNEPKIINIDFDFNTVVGSNVEFVQKLRNKFIEEAQHTIQAQINAIIDAISK